MKDARLVLGSACQRDVCPWEARTRADAQGSAHNHPQGSVLGQSRARLRRRRSCIPKRAAGQSVPRQGAASLDLKHRTARVARHHLLPLAIDQEIKVFQDNRTDERGATFRLNDRGKGSLAAENFNRRPLRLMMPRRASIGISHLNGATQWQTELSHHTLGQN